jgi:Spy/CpxP family protein refolding chaperone
MQRALSAGLLIVASACLAQAQQPRGAPSATFPWWANPHIVNTLNLSDAQTKLIHSAVDGHRDRLKDLSAAVNRAEADLQAVFNQDPVDQRKGRQAVDQLANSRGDLTRELADMSLELRTILTAQQWQDLQSDQLNHGGRGMPRRRGPNAGPAGSGPRTGASNPNSK